MKHHIEIIDGQEVVVKVYAAERAPKKFTAKTKSKTPRRIIIKNKSRRKQQQKQFE